MSAPSNKQHLLCILVLTLLSVSFPLQSEQIQTPEINKLAQDSQWLHLLHYHRVGLLSTFQSQVDDPDFFFSDHGHVDPQAELEATLAALKQNADGARCRFPARYHWLKQKLPDVFGVETDSESACEDYRAFRDEIAPEGLTLIFPAAYLNSPSSMFGHTLMRVDSHRHDNPLLDYSINYAANADPDDNELVFSYKGLTGGYPGVFSVLPYYEKVKEYSHLEARDVWEYTLDIDQDELEQFVRHVWEIKDVYFDYYFFTENCSYHLLTLLDAASERFDLSDEFYSDVIPADTVRVLNRAGLIREATFRPSSLTIMKSMQTQMTEPQIETARTLVERVKTGAAGDELLAPLEPLAAAQVLDLSYRYTRYLANKDRNDKSLPGTSLKLLSKRARNPVTDAFSPVETPEVRDDQGHRSHRQALSFGRALQQNYLQWGLRMAYHDWLDTLEGYIPGARLEIAHLQVKHWLGDDSRTQLETLRLIDIASMTPRDTFFKPLSWMVSTGLKRPDSQPDELMPYLSGGAGFSYSSNSLDRIAPLFSFLVHSEWMIDNDIEKDHRFGVGPKFVWLYQQEHWSANLQWYKTYDVSGAEFRASGVSLGLSRKLSQDWQVRIESGYAEFSSEQDNSDRDHSAQLSLNHYF